MMIMTVLMTIVTTVSAMTYTQARDEALFLTDKMAYELDLSYNQYEAVYEINLDYYLSVTSSSIFGAYWSRRNADLRYVLTNWQYDRYLELSYFYRPVQYSRNRWYFSIYTHYGKTQFYRDRPVAYSSYRGGHNRSSSSYYRGRDFDKPINNHFKPRSNDMPPHDGSSMGRPSTNDNRPSTGNNRPSTGNNRPSTGNSRPSTGNNRPSTGNNSPSTGNSRPSTGNNKSGTFGGKRQ